MDIDRNELFRLIMSTDKAREIRDNLKEKLGEGVRSFLVLFFADTEFTGEKMSISEKAYALAVCEENSV